MEKFYQIIINEPIYLTVTILFLLIIAYSVLKKLFKFLVILLIMLICYIGYLMYSGNNLPNDQQIHSIKEKMVKGVEKGIEKLEEISK